MPDCYEGTGETYRGETSRTRSGLPCGPWRDHNTSRERTAALSLATLDGSLCRNPDKDPHGPWCYTNNTALAWDYCRINPCEPSQNSIPPMGGMTLVSCFVHKRTRIVGGAPVGITDGSWMVSVQKGSSHWCGGSLIREQWVLTDRQCFSSCVPDLSVYRVWLGVSDLSDASPDRSRRQEVRIAHVVCGPEGSNLALIRLAKPALPAESVHTLQLPVAGCSISEGLICSMYGWGETKGTGHEGVLKEVRLPVVSKERCRQQHRGLHIDHSRICAGGTRDEGVCERDYGGPLVCQDGESRVIVGVSVHGRGCARAHRPGLFINVPFYTQWIYKVFKHYLDPEDAN